jgi:hypothetical protein
MVRPGRFRQEQRMTTSGSTSEIWTIDPAASGAAVVGRRLRRHGEHYHVARVNGPSRALGGTLRLDPGAIAGEGPGDGARPAGAAAPDGAPSPSLTFHGAAIDWLDATRVRLTGTLTLDELTSDVEFDTIYEGRSVDADGTPRATFRAETPFGAERAGLGWEALLEGDPLNGNDRLILAISAVPAASR